MVVDTSRRRFSSRFRGTLKVSFSILGFDFTADPSALDWPTAILLLPRAGIGLVILLLFQSTVYGSPMNRVGERDSAYFAPNGTLSPFASAVILTSVFPSTPLLIELKFSSQTMLLGSLSNFPRHHLIPRILDSPTSSRSNVVSHHSTRKLLDSI